jgi:HD-GYP domain-containing protein (c-di-GMP phosphodiesterase class II)
MLPSVASRVPVDRRPLSALRQRLCEAFEVEFDLWWFDDSWRLIPLDPSVEMEYATPDVAARLEPARVAAAEPMCAMGADGATHLLLPLPKFQRRPLAAMTRFVGESPSMLLRLARLFLTEFAERSELERMRHEHQAFLRQVTNDFEELTFLRSMSKLLEISDLSFDFVAMAQTMLPTLKPLLDTDLLVLVPADDFGNPAGDGKLPVLEANSRCSERGVSESTCWGLVDRYRELAIHQPVVKNNFDRMPDAIDFPGVNSFILVPIVNGDVTIGWLLALNRNNDRNLNAGELPWGISYLEFGTHEATLMSSSAAILATHARNVDLFREREGLLVSVVRALVSAIEAKDEYTRGHSERVALYGKRLAEELGYDDDYCERLYLTGLLHDVGKIGVRDAVLRKPGPLSDDEFEEIKQHPDKGWQILHDLDPLTYVLEGVLHHHEQFDGRGYPDRLAGRGIPLDGRILAVADAYDAMTSDRPYRTGMPQEKAETILRSGAGKQWDPEMVDAFFRCMPDVLKIKREYQPRIPEQRCPNRAVTPE